MSEDGFRFSTNYYIMPFDDIQGAFYVCISPINGSNSVVGCLAE